MGAKGTLAIAVIFSAWVGFLSLQDPGAPFALEDYQAMALTSSLLGPQLTDAPLAWLQYGWSVFALTRALPLDPSFYRIFSFVLWLGFAGVAVAAYRSLSARLPERFGPAAVFAGVVFLLSRSLHVDAIQWVHGLAVIPMGIGLGLWLVGLARWSEERLPIGSLAAGLTVGSLAGLHPWVFLGIAIAWRFLGAKEPMRLFGPVAVGLAVLAAAHLGLLAAGTLPLPSWNLPGRGTETPVIDLAKGVTDILALRQTMAVVVDFRATPSMVVYVAGYAAALAWLLATKLRGIAAFGGIWFALCWGWAAVAGDPVSPGFMLPAAMGLAITVGTIAESLWNRGRQHITLASSVAFALMLSLAANQSLRATALRSSLKARTAKTFQTAMFNVAKATPTLPKGAALFVFGLTDLSYGGEFHIPMKYQLTDPDARFYVINGGNAEELAVVDELGVDRCFFYEQKGERLAHLPELRERLADPNEIERFIRVIRGDTEVAL